MTSRVKIPPTKTPQKKSTKNIKTKPIYKNNNDLAERMSKYFLVSN